MTKVFKPGDRKEFRRTIQSSDVAAFDGEIVHDVYATFSLARDAEWTTRQFVMEMKSDDEEGVGTFLSVEHKSPAFVGEEIIFAAWVDHIEGNELICFYEARVKDRLIAIGKTGQRILPRTRIAKLFTREN